MEWKLIDPTNLPKGEVLALGHKGCILLGSLYQYIGYNNDVTCVNEDKVLFNCTHYLLASDLLNLEREQHEN